ncbi:hypothetical protein Pmani_018451 [Petrolisthes manimaculis]|uniref:Ig-like domain-containing protein n=1 Tax=Petrolisthes manimaculis TaxID=1843537 RepID=A0AAE1U4U7_9EUCA|nr:hypothetical protein Pmani_018451 [Petrolisthes manimaculis]
MYYARVGVSERSFINQRHPDKSTTQDTLQLLTSAADDGGLLECRASAPTLPHLTAADSTRLSVHYVPEATISIQGVGVGGGGGVRTAGQSTTLTCSARANPPAYNFTFLLNGRPLHRANVVSSNDSLTLLQLGHRDAGLYTCLASNSEGDGQSNAVPLHIDYPPVCAWEGAKEVVAWVGERVELECLVKASPPSVTFAWNSVTFTPNMEQIRSDMQHDDEGVASVGWVVATGGNVTGGAQRAECHPSNELGVADHPCIFTIITVGEPRALKGCAYHDVTTDSAGVTCTPDANVGHLAHIYHIEVREEGVLVGAYNNSQPKFNLTSLAPGRDYDVTLYASHARARGPPTSLLLKTHTPKAEQVAPERVAVDREEEGQERRRERQESRKKVNGGRENDKKAEGKVTEKKIHQAARRTRVKAGRRKWRHQARVEGEGKREEDDNFQRLLPSRRVILPMGEDPASPATDLPRPGLSSEGDGGDRGAALSVVVSGVVVGVVVGIAVVVAGELLATFSPGPVVVTQVTSNRSSRRSSPLLRRSSTRSAPGGTTHRGMRPRTSSCRGGPVHVLEVEADDIIKPRVEIHSPSKLSRLGLRSGSLKRITSPPLALRCDPLQKLESFSKPQSSSTQDNHQITGQRDHSKVNQSDEAKNSPNESSLVSLSDSRQFEAQSEAGNEYQHEGEEVHLPTENKPQCETSLSRQSSCVHLAPQHQPQVPPQQEVPASPHHHHHHHHHQRHHHTASPEHHPPLPTHQRRHSQPPSPLVMTSQNLTTTFNSPSPSPSPSPSTIVQRVTSPQPTPTMSPHLVTQHHRASPPIVCTPPPPATPPQSYDHLRTPSDDYSAPPDDLPAPPDGHPAPTDDHTSPSDDNPTTTDTLRPPDHQQR